MNNLSVLIEALLFATGRPISRSEIQKMTGAEPEAVESAIAELSSRHGGVVLVDDGKVLELRTAPEAAELVEKIRKEEYARELGRAGQEALSAILYRGPLTRAEIDFIRGVNSSQTLRTLLMRGLVRRIPNPKDERSFLYEPTTDLLSQLGITRAEHMPEFAEVKERLQKLEEAYRQNQSSQEQDSENA